MSLFIFACCANKHIETIDNLKAAANGETHASKSYAKYSEIAAQEGYINISRMFAATSEAEKHHAAKHIAELAKLGVNNYSPIIDEIVYGTTQENLVKAIEGETYEFSTMYPTFIKKALEEKQKGAETSFDWAMKAEKKHSDFYNNALKHLTDTTLGDSAFVYEWYVCPVCGDTYTNQSVPTDACELCGAPISIMLKF